MPLNRMLLLAVCLIFPAMVSARALSLEPGVEQYALESVVSYYEDRSGNLQFADVSALPEHAWVAGEKKTLNFGFTESAYWFRLVFHAKTGTGERWLLKIAYPHLDSIDVFLRDAGGNLTVMSGGDLYPFSARYVEHRHFLFPLQLPADREQVVLIRVRSESAFNVPLSLVRESAHLHGAANEQFAFGIYYGIILVMILYNLFLYLSARDAGYLLYVFFLIAVGLMNLSLNGYLPQYFTGNMVRLTNSAPPLFTEFSIATGILFSYFFLEIGKTKRFFHFAFVVVFIATIIAVIAHAFIPYKAAIITSNILTLFALPLMIAGGIYSLARGYKPARFYLLSWTLLLVGGAVFSLRNFGWLPDGTLAQYGLQIGSAAEMILLSLALGDRLRQLKEEREKALTQFVEEQKRALAKQQAMSASFARFVPQQFLTHLGKEHIEDVVLGDAVERQMAVLFSDIRSFTALSESMSPAQNFAFLNSYLSRVGPIVRNHAGFIDKYIGDAVMALFPEKAVDALDAAVDMQRELREFNHHRVKKNFEPVKIGVGLHSGSLYLGTIGEAERMDSTVISDTVNVASRIEHMTKTVGASVLVSGAMFSQIADRERFHARLLGRIPLRGKKEKMEIFEVFDGQSDYLLELFGQTIGHFKEGVTAFYARDFHTAAAAFARVLALNPADRVSQLYHARASQRSA